MKNKHPESTTQIKYGEKAYLPCIVLGKIRIFDANIDEKGAYIIYNELEPPNPKIR